MADAEFICSPFDWDVDDVDDDDFYVANHLSDLVSPEVAFEDQIFSSTDSSDKFGPPDVSPLDFVITEKNNFTSK